MMHFYLFFRFTLWMSFVLYFLHFYHLLALILEICICFMFRVFIIVSTMLFYFNKIPITYKKGNLY